MHFLKSSLKKYFSFPYFFGSRDILPIFSIIIFFCNPSYASSFATPSTTTDSSLLGKKINLKIYNQTFRSVIKTLNTVYKIDFIYVEEQIPWDRKITLHVSQKSLSFVMDMLVKHKDLTYFQVEDQIAITTAELKSGLQVDSTGKAEVNKDTLKVKPDPRYYKKIVFKVFERTNKQGKNYRLQTYYVKRNFSLWPKENKNEYQDSLKNLKDTISPKRKSTFINLKKIPGKNSRQLSIKISPSYVWWKVRSFSPGLVEDPTWNEYQNPQSSFAIEINYGLELRKNVMLAFGVGYLKLQKKGYLNGVKINTLIPLIEFTDRNAYSFHYSYLSLPVKLAYELNVHKFYILPGLGLQANFFTGSDMKYYSVYQTEYFTDINLLSNGNGNYFNKSGEPIRIQKTKFTKLVYSYLIFSEIGFKINPNFSIYTGAEIDGFMYSIYNKKSPLREVPFVLQLSLGSRIYF